MSCDDKRQEEEEDEEEESLQRCKSFAMMRPAHAPIFTLLTPHPTPNSNAFVTRGRKIPQHFHFETRQPLTLRKSLSIQPSFFSI